MGVRVSEAAKMKTLRFEEGFGYVFHERSVPDQIEQQMRVL